MIKNQKYLYVGSYIVTYDIENPNQIKDFILVERDNPNIDFNIYFDGIDKVVVPGDKILSFEENHTILDTNHDLLRNYYATLYQSFKRVKTKATRK